MVHDLDMTPQAIWSDNGEYDRFRRAPSSLDIIVRKNVKGNPRRGA